MRDRAMWRPGDGPLSARTPISGYQPSLHTGGVEVSITASTQNRVCTVLSVLSVLLLLPSSAWHIDP